MCNNLSYLKVQTVAGRRHDVAVSEGAPVFELRRACSEATSMPVDRLKLVWKGRTLLDSDPPPKLTPEATILALLAPKAPSEAVAGLVDAAPDEEEEEEIISISATLASIRWQAWAKLAMWAAAFIASCRIGYAIPFMLISAIGAMLVNLGKRGEGEASAYSIFNGFQELPGQLNAGHYERAIRRGEMLRL
eukprot:jgi/Tetstr1/458479/TSEL_004333.t1